MRAIQSQLKHVSLLHPPDCDVLMLQAQVLLPVNWPGAPPPPPPPGALETTGLWITGYTHVDLLLGISVTMAVMRLLSQSDVATLCFPLFRHWHNWWVLILKTSLFEVTIFSFNLFVNNLDETHWKAIVTICTAQWSLYVPPGLTFKTSTFCPHSVFMCFLWIWEPL
jgi:hypothetical protein